MSEKKTVTERDLRHPAFKHVSSIDDLEFNDFGEVVRKDRFEVALGNLSSRLYSSSHCVWSVSTVTEDVTHSVLAMRHEKSDKPLLLAVHYNDELLTHSTYNQQEYAALKSKEYVGNPAGCPDKPSYLEQIVDGKL